MNPNPIQYVKELINERTALLARLADIDAQLADLRGVMDASGTARPASILKPPPPRVNGHRPQPRSRTGNPAIETRILDWLTTHEPQTKQQIEQGIEAYVQAGLVSLVDQGRLVRRAWRTGLISTRPPFYYARTADVLDALERELIDTGQMYPSHPPRPSTASEDGAAGIVAGTVTTGSASRITADDAPISGHWTARTI